MAVNQDGEKTMNINAPQAPLVWANAGVHWMEGLPSEEVELEAE